MKHFKRILSAVLTLILVFGTVSVGVEGFSGLFATQASAVDTETLRENADGSFRILQLSDIQDNSYLSAKAFATIRLAVRKYNPNLIVLTGDNVLFCNGDDVFRTTVDSLVNEFVDASGNKIPFAVTFGNHDYEVNYHDENKTKKISLKEQYEYYLSKGAVKLAQDGLDTSSVSAETSDNSATLWGTGYLDVYTNDGSKVARRVVLLNTGSYDENNRDYFARVGCNVETQQEESYAKVVSAVNAWTNAKNSANETIKCIVYQHIALQEVYLGDSPATSILTKPTVAGSITHACYKYINNYDVRGTDPDTDPTLAKRKQYVVTTKNPTLTGTFDEAPKSSYNSTKDLFLALAKDNVIGLFYGHDHSNTVSAETKITYDGTQYTLTQGFGGGIDVYDGDYDGIDPQGSCYVIDKDGDLIKEAFSYTGLLTDDVTYPSGDEGVKYIKKVALFNGTSFAAACDEARKAGYIPITRAFSDGYNDADLNSNGRGTRKFTGSGDQYQCIAYQQTTNPDEAITDLRMFVTTDETYSINNQTKTYTLNEKESEYRIVSGCGGNVNYGVTSNTSCAFLYYTTNRNAGAPLTELVVESEESSSTDAYRTMDHRCLQIGNFVETFGTNAVSSFSKARIANLNWGANRDTVIGDSVYLFMKRYDGVSGYNTKYSYEAVTGVPETVFAPASSFRAYINRSLDSTGVATMDSTSSTTGKLYFYCPDATAVTVTAMSGTGSNAAVLSSCTAGNNGRMTKQSDGLFYAKITDGTVSGLNADSSGVIKWVFTYSIAGSSAIKTQIAYSTVVASAASNAVTADKTALRSFIGNLNQSTFVKDAENTFSCDNGFLTALANASYVLGNPAATQAEVDAEKEALLTAAEQTSMLYVPDTPDENVETLLESCGGYIYGVCQPNENYETLQDTGFNWVRFDIPCPFDKNGYNGGNIKYVRNEYKKFKERCQAYHDNGFKILAVTPYPKDLISDMSIQDPTGDFESFMDIAVDVATFLYNDLKDDGKGGRCVDMFQITNEMGLATFTLPLSLEQAATYVGEQLKVIDAEKKKTNDDFPIGYNSADLLQSSMDLHELLKPYLPYCDYVALDLYTGNQGEATAKDYSKTVRKLYSITQKPVIMTEFGFWSDGGLKSAAQKSAILYENYGYNSEAEAIADGQNFIDKLPAQFRKTLNQDYPDQEDKWPSLVFGKYANHFYGETSPYTINDIPHTPEGQGEYFREVMTELKKVGCLAGMIIYGCQDKDVCFNCGHSWCPYETKFGLFNYDGTPKPALTAIKETIASLSAQDGAAQGTATASDFDGTKTTVTVCHKSGSKTLLRAVGEVYKSSTVFTSTTSIPGYTCEYDSAVYANVSSALSESYQAYTPISYTATENANGETAVPFAIEGNDLVLVTPQRAGYRFVGWKATSVAGSALNQTDFIKNKVYAAGTYKGMYGNVGFDAQWQGNEYTVTFDVSNGGSVSTPSKKVVFGNPYGTLPEATAPDGKIFGGWFTAKTGGTLVTADSIYQTADNKTLYAHYGDTYYDVGYDNLFLIDKWNEGVKGETERGTTVYNSTNKSIALTSNSGSTDSYTSLDEGKYAMPVVGGQTYVFTAEVTVSATATLRPLARALDDSNTSKQVKELGQVSLSPGSTYIYHKEWTVPSDATKVAIRFGTTTGGVTVTYKNIRFVKKSVADQKVAYPTNTDTYLDGTTYVNLAKPTRVGYVFDGWYSDVNCTAGNEVDENDVALDHITVYSKWLKLNEVTYDNLFSISEYAASDSVNLNEISGTAQVDGEKGSVTVPGNPVSGGNSPYTSWNTSSGYYTIPVTGGTKYYLSFYVNTWGGNVFVNFDNGTATDTNMTKCSGTTYIGGVLDGTQAKKYTFYFKAPSGATKIGLRFGASATESRTYSDIKLIDAAHYYSDALYDSSFSYVAAGTAYGELQTPTRKGYRFDGWFDNTACTGNPITSTSVIGADNVKLYSKWIEAYDVMYNTIFDFDAWGAGQVKTGATYSTAVDFGRNSYTITANSNHEGEVTSSANGPSVYRMPVVAGHKYKVSADITTDSRNSGVVNYNFLVFEWPQSYSNSWNDYLSPISEKTFSVDSGVTQNCSFVFTAKSDTDTISLRLALKSDGASKGTFSDIRIQDITATPYPESFVQVNAATTDSLSVQPEREGYHAAGWYDTVSADGVVSGTQYTSVASLNGNKTLYPKYSQKIYNVTYISAIGTQQKVQSMVYGANPTTAYIPSVVGYRFIGWYSDPQRITYAPQTVTGPLTLYAKWELITCNIGFDNIFLLKAQNIADYENVDGNTVIESRKVDKNNGTITMTYHKSGDDSERNLTSKLIDLPSEAGDNTYYIVSADVATTDCQARIMTFFYDKDGNNCDIWHTNDSSHPVVEKDGMPNNIDGPIYDSGTNAHHYYVVKVPKGCQKIQLRFDCLNVDATKKRTAVFSNIRVVEKTANTYATIAANYRTLEGTVTYSKAYNLTTVTNPGYVFEGWYMDASCTVPVTASNCTMTSNHTLYSKWEMNTLDITYDNLFDIRAFTSNDAHLSVDGQVITVNANKTESDAYQIPVKGGEQYKLSYEQLASTSENSGYVFVKFHKADGTVIDADLCRRYSAEECTNYPHSNFAELSTDTGAAPGDWSIPNYNEKENVVAIIKCDGLSQATPYNWTISGIVASKRIIFNKVTNADIGADSQTNTFGAVDIRFYTPSETAYITLDFGSESTEGVSFRNIELQRLETYTIKDAVRTLAITTDAGHAKQQTGYTCSGWKMDGAESNITSGTYDLSAYENGVRLASQWNVNTYRIAYAGMDGATHGSNHPVSATYGTAFAVSAPIKTGYRFKGWTVTSGLDASGARWGATASPETVLSSVSTLCINGADDVYFLNLNDADDATVTLTANWEPNTATVHVKLDGVVWTNCNKQQIQLYQNGSHKYTIYPTEDKSVFVGSGIAVGTYDIYAGSGIGGYMDSGVTVTVDAASGAGTAEINYYTLTVKAGTGVSAVSGSGVYLCGIAAPVSATAKTGFDTPSFDATVSNGKYTVTETKTITASASEISYNVSFVNAKADNDQMPTASSWPDASVSYHINSDAVIPSASANGYTFGGWKVVSESAGSWTKGDTIAAGTALKGKQGDVTLSPIWTAKTDVAYKVEHYVMNTLGIYPTTPTATDDLKGTTDAALTLSTLTKNNFLVANGIEYKEGKVGGIVVTATTVAGDGSRVIKLYYERVAYTLTVSASNVSGAAVKVNGSDFTSGSKVRYGAEITMGTLSANAGYHNSQWSGLTAGINGKYYMPASDVTLTAQASVNEIYSVEQGTVVDTAKQFIYGVKVGDNDISRYISATEGFSYLANLANKRFATGDTVTVQHNDTTVCEYTVVVFGDVNGDGWYDGTDAMLVNFIVNGMLTRDKLGEAVWTAADCNHDGEINQADADLLEQAGLLLSQVNQTIPTEEITSNSIYQEYLELIDQSPATIEEEHSADESGEAAETEETSWITILWGFITRLFDYLKLIFLILK